MQFKNFIGVFCRGFSRILSPLLNLYYNSSTRFLELVKTTFSYFWINFCTVLVTALSNILMAMQFYSICNERDIFPSFLDIFLYVEWNTLFDETFLPLYSSKTLLNGIWLFLYIPVGDFWRFLNVFMAACRFIKFLVKTFQTRISDIFKAK